MAGLGAVGVGAAVPRARLPLVFWAALGMTLLSCAYRGEVLGVRVSGLGWSIPATFGAIVALANLERVRFPWKIWLPWAVTVAAYQLFAASPNALQRSLMMLAPIAVGTAASTFPAHDEDLELLLRVCSGAAVAFVVFILYDTGVLLRGVLPFTTGLAAVVMTGAIFCTLAAAAFAHGRWRQLALWGVLALIPVVAVTRMGMIATAISLPLTFAPLKRSLRVAFAVLIALCGLTIFQTERVQRKMFYSGAGSVEDVRFDNPEFATSGRAVFWDLMWSNFLKKPVFGHGANASEARLSAHAPGLTHPHNDWLRLLHDYGLFGAGLYALTLGAQTAHLVRAGAAARGATAIVLHATASLTLVYMLFMLSDNIILYASFFGNLQFALMGIAYGAVGEGGQARQRAAAVGRAA